MAGSGYIGQHVKLTIENDVCFEGFVHSMDIETKKLTLQRVTTTDGKKLAGLKNFYYDDIKDLIVTENELKRKDDEKIIQSNRSEKGEKLRHQKYTPAHLERLVDFDPKKHLLRTFSENKQDDSLKKANRSSDYDSSSDPEVLDAEETPYVLIDQFSQTFYDAIEAIRRCSIIGFSMEGVCLGRSGEACWIQFKADKDVFLFDVLELTSRCFEEGIKDILENSCILKVMHDCRLISDYLYHCHDIKLINVFDTQVADVFVYRLHRGGDWPRYVSGLADCVLSHIDIEPEYLHQMKIREKLKKGDQEVWAQRPIAKQLLLAAMKNVMFLPELRMVLMEKMMAEYVAGVDVYLSQVRDASRNDARKHQSNLLPVAFQELSSLMNPSDCSRWSSRARDNMKSSDLPGFRDNVNIINRSRVIMSHDSIWHEGHEGQKNFNKVKKHIKLVSGDQKTAEQNENVQKFVTSKTSEIADFPTVQSKVPQYLNKSTGCKTGLQTPYLTRENSKIRPDKDEKVSYCSGTINNLSDDNKNKDMTHHKTSFENPVNFSEPSPNLENVPVGSLIRSVIKQTDPDVLREQTEEVMFKPAGVMVSVSGKNQKTTSRRQKEVDELELEMAQYVTQAQSVPVNGESDYDDWGGTRRQPVVGQAKKDNSVLKRFLDLTEKAREDGTFYEQFEQEEREVTTPQPTIKNEHVSPSSRCGNSSELLKSFAAVRNKIEADNKTLEEKNRLITEEELNSINDNEGQRCLFRGHISQEHRFFQKSYNIPIPDKSPHQHTQSNTNTSTGSKNPSSDNQRVYQQPHNIQDPMSSNNSPFNHNGTKSVQSSQSFTPINPLSNPRLQLLHQKSPTKSDCSPSTSPQMQSPQHNSPPPVQNIEQLNKTLNQILPKMQPKLSTINSSTPVTYPTKRVPQSHPSLETPSPSSTSSDNAVNQRLSASKLENLKRLVSTIKQSEQ